MVKKTSQIVLNSVVWGPLLNSSKQCMWGPLVNSAYGPTVNSAMWAPRGARTHGVAPILGPLVYVLNSRKTGKSPHSTCPCSKHELL